MVCPLFCNFADMKSLRELYRIGKGPSSSHTMGPQKASQIYLKAHPDAKGFRVTLYGSLAATGKGHMTDVAIREVLEPVAPVEIVWKPIERLPFHPNGMKFETITSQNLSPSPSPSGMEDTKPSFSNTWIVYSVGGGALSEGNNKDDYGKASPLPEGEGLGEMSEWLVERLISLYRLWLKSSNRVSSSPTLYCLSLACWKTMKKTANTRNMESTLRYSFLPTGIDFI